MKKIPKKISADELSNLRMVAGAEKRITHVIQADTLKEWVGIGWIDLRKATAEDRKKYPEVT